jgi:hypothetical protein
MSLSRVSSSASDLNDFTESEDGKKVYNVSKSRLLSLIDWMHVVGSYFPLLWAAGTMYCIYRVLLSILLHREALNAFLAPDAAQVTLPRDLVMESVILVVVLALYFSRRQKEVYLVDFVCFEPPENWKLSPEQLLTIMKSIGVFTDESLSFLERLLQQSGCGPATAWPPGIVRCLEGLPQDRSVESARREAEIVMYDCVRNVLKKTGVRPRDIDILVINCSLFSPTPSLCSMIVNEFGLKPNVSSYNLSGMVCTLCFLPKVVTCSFL